MLKKFNVEKATSYEDSFKLTCHINLNAKLNRMSCNLRNKKVNWRKKSRTMVVYSCGR